MTLQIAQLLDQVEQAAEALAAQRREVDELACEAFGRLEEFSDRPELLADKAEEARRRLGGNWRGAEPAGEPVGAAYDLHEGVDPVRHVIATDGSQIFPDRHSIAYYALVNIGAIHIRPGSGEPPAQTTFPDLIYGDRLQEEGQFASRAAGDVSLERDKQELSRLIELSAAQDGATAALTDGPLLLWILDQAGRRPELASWFAEQLREAEAAGVLLAGYVDRPGSRGVTDLLALADLPDDQIREANPQVRRYKPLPDRALFQRLLAPGQRSAVLTSASPYNRELRKFGAALEIALFYINVGGEDDAVIARVETPCWVAKDGHRLGQLHSAIWEQCQAPGRYPYALARAHEIAVVNADQRVLLETLLGGAMLERGLTPQASAKSFLKTLTAG
jgi:hypothetical protein